jgi:uncharacterized 2Fe-2S/4Fe-4S cluster protein (DUF4445 family)
MRFLKAELRPEPGHKLLDLLVRQTGTLLSVCGGRGRCGKCRVRILQGAVTPLSEKEHQLLGPEEIRSGFRLACSCSARERLEVAIPEWEVMGGARTPPKSKVKSQKSKCRAAKAEHGRRTAVSGLAIDVGTTNVAVAGWDLKRRKRVRAESFLNPQMSFGMDVISRISQSKALIRDDALAPAIRARIESWGSRLSDVSRIVAVGNTVMCHFLLGQDASSLGVYPYRSALPLRKPLSRVVSGLGRRKVLVLPMIGSYLGADTAAAIVASGIHRNRELSLLMDLGTNGEIVLGNERQLIACSTAAGPALEGANLSCGVLARPGAITDYRLPQECRTGQTPQTSLTFPRLVVGGWRTVGGRKPIGFCGSAVIKLLSELLKHGFLEPNRSEEHTSELQSLS